MAGHRLVWRSSAVSCHQPGLPRLSGRQTAGAATCHQPEPPGRSERGAWERLPMRTSRDNRVERWVMPHHRFLEPGPWSGHWAPAYTV